ncbi:hypothetical protein [Phenylobacterium sp.]|uniref:hypothetical protein n=1 Tax=Phenylobacterium sp. TaxID=1871053 RepID=UPI00120524B4|nr:hypothetical protein [Phenylobacterium sp.]THD59515.1 MAG: hypothetical protein E8A49_16140 [Phenylobacterium sp.]
MNHGPPNPVTAALAIGAVLGLALALAACHQMTPQEKARQMVHDCAADADEHLDPRWGPREVTGVYPAADGTVNAIIAARGAQATVVCGVASGYYTHAVAGVATIDGVEPAPGQTYLPMQHRWLTAAELHARLTGLLAPRFLEYAGVAWAPNPPGVYTVSNLAGVPSTACFTAQSRRNPAHQLVACQVAAGHRYWVSQGLLVLELIKPPMGLRPIPPAPPADLAARPGGVPR